MNVTFGDGVTTINIPDDYIFSVSEHLGGTEIEIKVVENI